MSGFFCRKSSVSCLLPLQTVFFEQITMHVPHRGMAASLKCSIYVNAVESSALGFVSYACFIYISVDLWIFILYFILKSNIALFVFLLKLFQLGSLQLIFNWAVCFPVVEYEEHFLYFPCMSFTRYAFQRFSPNLWPIFSFFSQCLSYSRRLWF